MPVINAIIWWRSGEPFGHLEKCRWVFWINPLKNKQWNKIVTVRSLQERRHDFGPKTSFQNRRFVKRWFFQRFQRQLVRWPQHWKDLTPTLKGFLKPVDFEKFPMEHAKNIFWLFWSVFIKAFRLLSLLLWNGVFWQVKHFQFISG